MHPSDPRHATSPRIGESVSSRAGTSSRRLFAQIVVCVVGAFLTSSSQAASQPTRPNVLLILADDLGWGDLGCYNRESKIPTPHLDRLATEGMRFVDAHSPSAVCSPTRYGILTGRYAWRTRLKQGVLWGYSPPLIEPNRPTLPGFLRNHGYRTAGFGKWHLGLTFSTTAPAVFGDALVPKSDVGLIDWSRPLLAGPATAGFDSYFGIPASLDMVPYVWIETDRIAQPPTVQLAGDRSQRQGGNGFWRGGPASPGFSIENCQPILTSRAVEFLRQQTPETPFFAYVPMTSPHDPWVPTPEFRGRSGAGPRGDFVAQVDHEVDQMLAALEASGLARNTLVLFTSDNGAHWLPDEVTRTGHAANGPWRGMKSDAFEGGHRVPLLARWPGVVSPGSTSRALVGLQDIFATVAHALGESTPLGAAEDSVSFLSALKGRRHARPPLVLHSIQGTFALRDGPWKLIQGPGSGGWTATTSKNAPQLYNLRRDPGETINQFDPESSRAVRMTRQLATIQSLR